MSHGATSTAELRRGKRFLQETRSTLWLQQCSFTGDWDTVDDSLHALSTAGVKKEIRIHKL